MFFVIHRTPFIIVGNKLDLRDDPTMLKVLAEQGLQPIAFETGRQFAQQTGAAKYIECSARTQEGLRDVFDEAVRLVLIGKRKSVCCIKKCNCV